MRNVNTDGSLFLSTPSARRATASGSASLLRSANFYPRPPRGGRPRIPGLPAYRQIFLSTPSARRATEMTVYYFKLWEISIHALREEGDDPKI